MLTTQFQKRNDLPTFYVQKLIGHISSQYPKYEPKLLYFVDEFIDILIKNVEYASNLGHTVCHVNAVAIMISSITFGS